MELRQSLIPVVLQPKGEAGPAPFMFQDNFNRPNEDLETSPNWTRIGGSAGDIRVNNNQLQFQNITTDGAAYLCPDIGSADMYAQATWESDTNSIGWLIVRATDQNNFIGIRRGSTNFLQIYTRIAGTLTKLADGPVVATDDLIRIEVVGSIITARVNNILALGPIDNLQHAGVTRAGFCSRFMADIRAWDNFKAGAL